MRESRRNKCRRRMGMKMDNKKGEGRRVLKRDKRRVLKRDME